MKIGWDDIEFFYTIAAYGGIVEAAQKLKVNQTTVLRRIDHLEKVLGYPLFIRGRGKYKLTTQGENLFLYASKIAADMQMIDFELRSFQQNKKSIRVTISLPDFVYEYAVKDGIQRFNKKYPAILLSFVVTNSFLNLSNQEVDIIVRLTDNPSSHLPEGLHGKRVGDVNLCAYCPAEGTKEPVDWIGWGASVDFNEWIQENQYPAGTVNTSIDNLILHLSQAKTSGQHLILPCWIGDRDKEMRRVYGAKPFKGFDAWILTHPSLKKSEPIVAVIDFLYSSFKRALSKE